MTVINGMRNPQRFLPTTGLILLITFFWFGNGFNLTQMSVPLRVAIAFLFVLIPGGITGYGLSGGKRWSWIRFVGVGLPISIAYMGILGILARTLHLTISHMSFIWYVMSITGILFVAYRVQLPSDHKTHLRPEKVTLFYSVIALVIVLMFTVVAPFTMHKTNDILLHDAEVTYFASDQPIDWNEIYFETGNRISDRISLAYWRVTQALMVHLIDVHILTTQLYVSSMLMIFGACSIYVMARLFDHSIQTSVFIVILHYLIFAVLTQVDRQAGDEILTRFIQDKVLAGIGLSPIIYGICYRISQQPTRKLYLLLVLVLFGAIFTHPILAGFAIAVVGLWMLTNSLINRKLRPYLLISLTCILVFSPIAVVRFTTDLEFNFGDDKVDTEDIRTWSNEDGSLYAAPPEIVSSVTYVLVFVIGVASLIRFRQGDHERLHLAYVLIVAVGLIPYTAWIYGKIVSVYHVYRVVWIIPYGYAVWYALSAFASFADNLLPAHSVKLRHYGSILLVAVAPLFVASQLARPMEKLPLHLHLININNELIEIGAYLESQTPADERVVVLGDYYLRFRDYVAVISHVAQPVSLCEVRCLMNFTSISEQDASDRLKKTVRFFSGEHDNARRLETIETYKVDYIIYHRDPTQKQLDELFDEYPEVFQQVFETQTFVVVHVNKSVWG